MLTVVMIGKWSDDILYSVLDCVVISVADVCCSVEFGTLVGVFVFIGLSC